MPESNFDFRFAVRDSQGDRPYQEDYGRVLSVRLGQGDEATEGVLAVLCDGMGGHVSGEVASKHATEAFIKAFGTLNGGIGDRLSKSLDASNQALATAIEADPNLKGMGCTLVGVLADSSGLRWVSVGDSALLLYRNGNLHRLNEDHSLGALLDKQAAAQVISREEAAKSPRRRTLRSALTGGPVALREVHDTPVKLKSGDWIVVASDGLETLNGNEIASLIRKSDAAGPTGLADHLVKAVIDRKAPNQDNITLIPIYVHDPEDLHSQPTQWVQRADNEQPAKRSSGVLGGVLVALLAFVALAVGAGAYLWKDGRLDLRSLGGLFVTESKTGSSKTTTGQSGRDGVTAGRGPARSESKVSSSSEDQADPGSGSGDTPRATADEPAPTQASGGSSVTQSGSERAQEPSEDKGIARVPPPRQGSAGARAAPNAPVAEGAETAAGSGRQAKEADVTGPAQPDGQKSGVGDDPDQPL